MKTFKKLLPLSTVAVVGTIPVVATSCSQVWQDVLNTKYVPTNIKRIGDRAGDPEQPEISSYEAVSEYLTTFKDNPSLSISDLYWGASAYAREYGHKLNPYLTFQTFLINMDNMKWFHRDGEDFYRTSYNLRCQVQARIDTRPDHKGSYSIRTFDLSFNIQNLEMYFQYVEPFTYDGEDIYMWILCPAKFNTDTQTWFRELEGDERIVFEFKTVTKGYSENGAQNFIKEINESAIVDEQHKYIPQVSEAYTNALLFNSYFLSKSIRRIPVDRSQFPTTAAHNKTTSTTVKFKVSPETAKEFGGETLKVSLDDTFYIRSPLGAETKLADMKPTPATQTITIPTESQDIEVTFDIEFEDEPADLDTVYYAIKLTHESSVEHPKYWHEWFPAYCTVAIK